MQWRCKRKSDLPIAPISTFEVVFMVSHGGQKIKQELENDHKQTCRSGGLIKADLLKDLGSVQDLIFKPGLGHPGTLTSK
jgi:hypothetical protein